MGRRRKVRFFVEELKDMELSNSVLEEYYKSQLMLDDADFDEFLKVMRTPLPVTFRITGFRQQNRELLSLLQENYLHSIIKHNIDQSDEKVSVVPLKWYPGNMAWQINSTRLAIRKSPELQQLQKFLVSESEAGNLSRQEAVSMLPPLVLNVKEHHAVLDLCAAPGSKSAQLVELLHADAENKFTDVDSYAEPSGIVVANDVDRKRCYMLAHQVKRLQSPCVILTEKDASTYPRLFISSPEKPDEVRQMLFDRVLADVPCSGDGTLRKSPDIWSRWRPNVARQHHELQRRILRRGLELLRVPQSPEDPDPPRLVYSTCTLNPLEDEAVVASILEACRGTVRLVEPDFMCLSGSEAAKAGGFIARPGLKTWRVMSNSEKWYSKHDEVTDRERKYFQSSLFPPENAEELHLEHCRRVFPHDQDTGGFFIAVLEKIADLPWMNSRQKLEKTIEPNNADDGSEPVAKKPRLAEQGRKEASFVFMDPTTDKDWPSIRDFYGFGERESCLFNLNPAQILYRAGTAGDPVRRRYLYYTNPLVKGVIQANNNGAVPIVSGGVKLFAVCDEKQFVGYRFLHDGIHLACAFLPQLPKELRRYPPQLCHRRISLSASERDDLVLLLLEEMPLAERFTKATRDQWEQLSTGPVLVDYDPAAPSDPSRVTSESKMEESSRPRPHCRIAFAAWRGVKSLRNHIDRYERLHFLRLCGLDASVPLITGRNGRPRGDADGGGDAAMEVE
ncbi:tRNA cytosine34 C5 methyltransferase [Echinococcus multilocularis]|uniref:tRNA (cytosine(34)-C(5))-methyltransferase n=1 Tax=Echinococcus multilocularis TaxID=6211 RepID=A0A087W1D2_ECHMU|nr:tRNA cytosine34 C5 methyltransferase [Echinococcus multilocularis]